MPDMRSVSNRIGGARPRKLLANCTHDVVCDFGACQPRIGDETDVTSQVGVAPGVKCIGISVKLEVVSHAVGGLLFFPKRPMSLIVVARARPMAVWMGSSCVMVKP